MKSKVIILGANGQIGSLILNELIGSETLLPVAVVRSKLAAIILKEKIKKEFEIIITDFSNKKFNNNLDCSYVINTSFAIGNSIKKDRELNINIFNNVLKLKNIKKFIHLSSVAVYGLNKFSTFENPKPHNSYGREKLFHEKYIKTNFKKKGVDFAILRVGHLYGNGCPLSKYIHECENNKKFKIPFPKIGSNFVSKPRLIFGILSSIDVNYKNCVFNLIDNPNKTYEQIFKFHFLREKNVCSLSDVEAKLESKFIYGEIQLTSKIVKSILNYLNDFLKLKIFNNTSFRNMMDYILVNAPKTLENFIRKKYKEKSVKSQINEYKNENRYNFPDFLFWPAIPRSKNNSFELDGKEFSLVDEKRKLHHWYKNIKFEIN